MKLVFVYAFPFAMIMAACLDLLTMKLPNRFVIAFAAMFVPAAIACGLGVQEMAMHLAAGAAMLAVSFALFIPGWIGGGDAKFFAATALWLGWDHLLEFALLAAVFGGGLTLAVLALRALPLPVFLSRREWALRLHRPTTGIPYGIAMAMAGVLIFSQTNWAASVGM